MAGEWSLTGPCAGDIIHIVYFTFSMNFLSFGCTIFRGNQVMKKTFSGAAQSGGKGQNRWQEVFTFAKLLRSQNFHFLKYVAFTKSKKQSSISSICCSYPSLKGLRKWFANRFFSPSRESKFWGKKSVSPFDSSLNFSSNSGEKSYFAIWLDIDQ